MLNVRGDRLPPALQREAKRVFVNRYTITHKPAWAHARDAAGAPYAPQFLSDADWLASTLFPVTEDGRLSLSRPYCRSYPTWPSRPDLAARSAPCPEGDPLPIHKARVKAA